MEKLIEVLQKSTQVGYDFAAQLAPQMVEAYVFYWLGVVISTFAASVTLGLISHCNLRNIYELHKEYDKRYCDAEFAQITRRWIIGIVFGLGSLGTGIATLANLPLVISLLNSPAGAVAARMLKLI